MANRMKRKARVKSQGPAAAPSSEPKYPYTLTPKALDRFLSLVPDRPKPPKVTADTLKTWGFKNNNDRTILSVLKKLELLSASGEPTQYYADYMRKGSGAAILGKRVREIYSELFQNVTAPEKASEEELLNFFNINSGGSPQTIRLQIKTFKALSTHATYGPEDPLADGAEKTEAEDQSGYRAEGGPTVRVDLHIHLPENKTKADYDAILESIAVHLYRKPRS